MLLLSSLALFSSFLSPFVFALPALAPRQSSPLPPSQDPFYTAPPGFETAAPGTVLRFRLAPGNITAIANCSTAYNILYRTTDSHYQPSWAVTTLYVPFSASQQGANGTGPGHALLSYQYPYDSAGVDAAPSYAFLSAPPADITASLGRGWFVNSADYEGPKAAFSAGVNSGHAVIDSIRAVLSVAAAKPAISLSPNATVALWGYSGGALASEWATEIAVQYAPELSIAGAAFGGLPANATTVLDNVNNGPYAALIPSALVGLGNEWPDFNNYLLSRLHPTGPFNATTFYSAVTSAGGILAAFPTFAGQDIFAYFLGGRADLDAPAFQTVFNQDTIMGYHGVPQMPLFVYVAIGDEVVGSADSDALVERWCGIGVNVLYQRNEIGGHTDEFENGDASAVQWLSAVFDGTYGEVYSSAGCTVMNVSVNGTDTGL